MKIPHLCVCVCTYRRPELLRRLLQAVSQQQTAAPDFTLSCVVVDNDSERSAETVAREFQEAGTLKLTYVTEPERNFAIVRNTAVAHAEGDYIAFIDDDEVPKENWLVTLLRTLQHYRCDGILGPVRPYFDTTPPRWLERSRLCERQAHPTGTILNWEQTRTGNVLLKREIFEESGIRFDPAFRTGGEDVDFFRRAMQAGRTFLWCEEAAVYELVPPERMRMAYHLKRALLQGGISWKYEAGRRRLADAAKVGLKSVVALAAYTILLPITLVSGSHRAIRLLIKQCHHLGRLSALVGHPIIRERSL